MRFDKLAAFQIQSIAYKSHYENVPFEIPESWCWTTLGELFDIVSAKRVLQSDWQRTGIPFYRAREIVRLSYEGYVDNDLFITEEHYNNLKKSYGVPEPSDIMLSAVGTIGRAYVVRNNDVFYYKDASVLCLRNVYHLNSEFIKWILSSDLLQNQMYENSKGTTVDTITIEKANNYFLPLPPIDEQYRIVKLLCKWNAYINDINKNKEVILNNIRTCKSKILDLAISGKLVSQDPNDEPAIELLKRINPDFEPCDNSHYGNLPFEVPDGWCWATLGSIGKWQSGATPSRMRKDYYGGDIPWLKTGDLNDWYITDIPEYITQQALNETSVKLNPAGSILIAMYGATIGKIGILTMPATTNQACCACISHNGIEQMYLFYYLLSHKGEFVRQGGGGAQPNISKEKIVETLIPIPPLSEQLRIIKAIEAIFNQIDNITAEIS